MNFASMTLTQALLFLMAQTGTVVGTDAEVAGREGSSAALQAQFDGAWPGFRVLVSSNGNRYTKTSATRYADGGRMVQEGSATSPASLAGAYTCPSGAVVGNVVCLDTGVPGGVLLADANDPNLFPPIGVIATKPTATTCTVCTEGEVTVTGPLTPSATYYLSTTAGGLTATAPVGASEFPYKVGVAKTATVLVVGASPSTQVNLYALAGSAAAPSVTFAGDTDLGFYRAAANQLGVTANGAQVALFTTTGFQTLSGTSVAPSLAFLAEPTLGLCRAAANQIGFASNGGLVGSIGTAGFALSRAENTTGGSVTVDAIVGVFRILAGAGVAPITIVNNRVASVNSIVILTPKRSDATLAGLSGSCAANALTIQASANATADTDVQFLVINPA